MITLLLASWWPAHLAAQVGDSAPRSTASPHVVRWYEAAAAVGGVGLLAALDEPVQRFVQGHRSRASDDVSGVFRYEPAYYLGISAGLFAAGLATRSTQLERTGARVITSMLAATVVSTGIKYVAGRSRPAEEMGAFELHPLSSRQDSAGTELRRSMPSGHATAAFAAAAALADDIHSPAADLALYALAAGTAWSRLNDNRHWLSDTGLGAILGITTAKVIGGRWRIFGLRPPRLVAAADGAPLLEWQLSF